jgi:hypothetical protein
MDIAAELAQPNHSTLSRRAIAIAKGLRISGRARAPRSDDERDDLGARWLRLNGRHGNFYFVSADGTELLRGEDFASAEPLQAGFLDRMASIGSDVMGWTAPHRRSCAMMWP